MVVLSEESPKGRGNKRKAGDAPDPFWAHSFDGGDRVLGFTDPLAAGAPLGAWDRSP